MKYKCLIVDDEELARRLLANHLSQLDDFELVASCENAIEASKVLKKEAIDLMFLDIEMPILKGNDFLKNLPTIPQFIFTTAYRDYALDGFELNAVDYLLKPIVFGRFFKAIEKFRSIHLPKTTTEDIRPSFIFIKKDRKQIRLLFDEILYIESLKDYIKIHLKDKKLVVKYSISAFEKELDTRFLRVHRSYLINTQKMTAYTKHDIEIGKTEVPIGESYKNKVFEKLKNLLIK